MRLPTDLAVRRRLASRMLVGIVLASVAAALLAGPVRQPAAYHDFADRRPVLGIPHAADVLSNLPFLFVGVAAIRAALRARRSAPSAPLYGEHTSFLAYGVGVLLTAFGSAWYHLDPTDASLVWDRLPLALAFVAFFASILGERLGARVGRAALVPMLLLGPSSVALWAMSLSDAPGGDLRPYLVVRWAPVVAAIPLLILVPEPRATRRPVVLSLAAFGLATALELSDRPVFEATGGFVSGHTLKHLVAAVAAWLLVVWFAIPRAGEGAGPPAKGSA